MSIGMFLVGTIIFSVYVTFLIWNIFYSARKSREENYPNFTLTGRPKYSKYKNKKETVK
jgi:hypothetical protein